MSRHFLFRHSPLPSFPHRTPSSGARPPNRGDSPVLPLQALLSNVEGSTCSTGNSCVPPPLKSCNLFAYRVQTLRYQPSAYRKIALPLPSQKSQNLFNSLLLQSFHKRALSTNLKNLERYEFMVLTNNKSCCFFFF